MRSYDYKNNLPIDYIIDRSQVGDQTFLEVLEIHLKAGFDILERPSNAQKAKKAVKEAKGKTKAKTKAKQGNRRNFL